MNKSQKIIFVILTIFIILVALFLALYYNPVMHYTISKPVNEKSDNFCELPVLTYGTRFNMPLPKKDKDIIVSFNKQRQEIYEDIINNYDSPRRITVEVTENGNSTEFLFTGTVTQRGETINYHSGFSIDKKIKAQ